MTYQEYGENVPNAQPVVLEGLQAKSVHAFNIMGGKLDWGAIESVTAYLDIRNEELELFIDNLVHFQEFQARKHD